MRWRIRYQLLVPLLLLLVGVVGISIWVALSEIARAQAGIEQRMRHVAQTLSESPQFPLVGTVLEQMKKLSGADYVFVGVGQRVSTLTADPSELPAVETIVDDWRTLRLGPPVTVAGERYRGSGVRLRPPRAGETLYILYPESLWRGAVWDALWPILLLGGTTALASIAIAVGLGQRLAGRIQELDRRTRRIAEGDFSPMPLPDRNDEVRDLAGSVNEMAAQLARYQDTMLRSERLRLLGQVGGGLAHQLRNGLTGARLALQVYLQEKTDPTDTAALDVALRQLTLLETHLKRFLDLGRAENTRRVPCDLSALVSDAVELLHPQCRHSNIELCWQPPLEEATVLGDGGQLGQVVVNLLTNAIEAAGPGGRIDCGLRSGENGITLEVRDTGPGPAAEIASRLFEPFVTGKPEGVGLGLAVAKQVVEEHGGRVEWQRENGQTCFRVGLPAVARPALARSGA